jgi:hypothetical protein
MNDRKRIRISVLKKWGEGVVSDWSMKNPVYHRERILKSSTLSCNEEKEEITKPPTR